MDAELGRSGLWELESAFLMSLVTGRSCRVLSSSTLAAFSVALALSTSHPIHSTLALSFFSSSSSIIHLSFKFLSFSHTLSTTLPRSIVSPWTFFSFLFPSFFFVRWSRLRSPSTSHSFPYLCFFFQMRVSWFWVILFRFCCIPYLPLILRISSVRQSFSFFFSL